MSRIHGVVNHFKYWCSNWSIVASSFVLVLSGALVAGTIARAGENALAYNYGYPGGNTAGYGYGCQTNCHGNTPPVQTPCQGWNTGYKCGQRPQPTVQPCGQRCHPQPTPTYYPRPIGNKCTIGCTQNHQYPPRPTQQPCRQYCGGQPVHPVYPNYPVYPGGGQRPQPQPQPAPEPPVVPAPQAPVNNNENTNNNSSNNSSSNSAVANVVVNPASTVIPASTVSGGGKSAPAPSGELMLPETGATDSGLVNLLGIGGVVAAGTAYAASRRELLRTVFRKQ